MKNFIIKFLLFLFAIILGIIVLDIYISRSLKTANVYAVGEYNTWNDLFNGDINSKVVIYGSSKAWQHISPAILAQKIPTTFYNLGIDGHNFDLQYLRHELLLERNNQPKYIIQEVDEFTLTKYENLYNLQQFLPYMLWNFKIEDCISKFNGFNTFDYKIPLLRYYKTKGSVRVAFQLYKNELPNNKTRFKGYQGLDFGSKFSSKDLKKLRYKVEVDKAFVLLFDAFLKECKQKNIKVILVNTPEFIEGQKCVINRKETMNLFTRFSKKYKVPFYDYSNDSISYNKELFYNALHMNKRGSEIFSAKFADQVKKDILFTVKHQTSNIKH